MTFTSVTTPVPSGVFTTLPTPGVMPVSYTHLDVYKRQGDAQITQRSVHAFFHLMGQQVYPGAAVACHAVINPLFVSVRTK